MRLSDAEYESLTLPIIQSFCELGLAVKDLYDLVNQRKKLPDAAVDLALDWLAKIDNPEVLEPLVRALAMPRNKGYDGRQLALKYDSISDFNFRWLIINTLASACPSKIDEWLAIKCQDPYFAETLASLE